ncbi:hypothetical protein EDC04DRAFT_2690687, partial [Pisolithus marmoratus]
LLSIAPVPGQVSCLLVCLSSGKLCLPLCQPHRTCPFQAPAIERRKWNLSGADAQGHLMYSVHAQLCFSNVCMRV